MRHPAPVIAICMGTRPKYQHDVHSGYRYDNIPGTHVATIAVDPYIDHNGDLSGREQVPF